MVYQILDKFPDDHPLPNVPAQLWLLLTLEVVVRDSFGANLLLTYPSYPLDPQLMPSDEGYWAPPFCGFPVPITYAAPETVGMVRRLFREHEQQIDRKREIEQLAYVMGLPSPTISERSSFLELKTSPRSPDSVKCYQVVRYTLDSIGPRGRRNLADPECRKGYVFLPLERLDDALQRIPSQPKKSQARAYLGKPLISNLHQIIGSDESLADLSSRAISLTPMEFRREEEGLLVAVDLAGYGTACKYAAEHMH